MNTLRKVPAALKTFVSKFPQTIGFRGHETNITSKSAYDTRIVGYLKATVNTAGRERPFIRNVAASSKICYFEIRCDGKLANRLDTIVGNDDKNLRLPESYVMDETDITDARIETFSNQFGFRIDKATTETTLGTIKNGDNAYTPNTNSICIDGALNTAIQAAAQAAAALADDDKPIFKLLTNPEDIAFFIVDLAGNKIYTCRLYGTNYKVNWEGDVTDGVRKGISIPTVPASWNDVWSYISFFTVPDLSKQVQDSDINFYPRTNLRFTGAEAAATDYKKIPPPFYLAFTPVSKTMAAVLRVQGTIANVNYQAEQTAARTDIDDKQAEKVSVKEEVGFITRLDKFGCQQDDNNLLDETTCNKVTTIKGALADRAKALSVGGRRSKRNKHRRNKRTVSRRGRGHKRSHRVDGGSRKCGKKCRRKHTRK